MSYITNPNNLVSTLNSFTESLTSGQTVNGSFENVLDYNSVFVNINADQDSAGAGVKLEFSYDSAGSYVFKTINYNYRANQVGNYEIPVYAPYFRASYTNGGTSASSFFLKTVYRLVRVTSQLTDDKSLRDAFGRIRISNPQNLLDIKHVHDKNNSQVSEAIVNASGTTTSTHDSGSFVIMKVGSTSGDTVVRQSRCYAPYQPGKSHLVLLTGVLDYGAAGDGSDTNGTAVITRIGYYDTVKGYYYEYTAGTLYLVERTGSTNTRIASSSWNIDPLDGTGPSGVSIDVTKTQIFIMDLEWLGVGSVRCGIVHQGHIYYVHQFDHDNLLNVPYIESATLPIRYEIISDGDTGSMTQICGTVISEGGRDMTGISFAIDRGHSTATANTTTEVPVISIRQLNPSNHHVIIPKLVSLLAGSSDNILMRVRLILDPSDGSISSNVNWTQVNSDSSVQYDITATDIDTANSVLLNSAYFASQTRSLTINTSTTYNNLRLLCANVSDVSSIISVTALNAGTGTADVFGSIEWVEVN